MNSQDMSIYWNQRKGQYETNNFYQEQQNPYTITADRRLKYTTEEIVEENEVDSEASISIAGWFATILLLAIPGVNVIAVLAMAFTSKNENKKAFARAMVLFILITITVILVIMALTCDKVNYASIIEKFADLIKVLFIKMKGVI